MTFGKYSKAILAFLIAAAGVLMTALGTSPQQNLSHLDTTAWLTIIAGLIATPALTALVENIPGIAGGIMKAFLASGGAFVTALITALSDSILTQSELIGAISAGLVALAGVYQITNGVRVTPPNYP